MDAKELKFTQTVQEHKRMIYTVCYMFSQDSDQVNDLFQEILIKIWNGWDSFKGNSDIKTWIYRISLNTCINYDKKQKRGGQKVELDVNMGEGDDQGEKKSQIKQLYNRINRLGLVDRGIVLLWLEGLSYDEIGDIIGISAKNVSVKLVRIREQLKNMKNN